MMSPLAVSTDLESPEFPFDVALFDGASQVFPWNAIGAVYRGRQLVVAGDQKQLPPCTSFDRMVNNDDDSEDADDLGDFESVLDVWCSIGLPSKRLRWHYRSRREPPIAFSNHHFYDDDLVTFPRPDDLDGSTAVHRRHPGRSRSALPANACGPPSPPAENNNATSSSSSTPASKPNSNNSRPQPWQLTDSVNGLRGLVTQL